MAKLRRQNPIKGGRSKNTVYLLREVRKAVEKEAAQLKCSKSLVESVRLAESYGIVEEEENESDRNHPKVTKGRRHAGRTNDSRYAH